MFDNHDGMGELDYGVECNWCHGSANLLDIHGSCSTCHGGARSSFVTWDKGCQQGSCHPSYHDSAAAGHENAYNSSDCESECHNSDWTVPAENCGYCHSLVDSVAPTSYSDAGVTYVGPAQIHLSASDPFPSSGIATTYYKLDGGADAQGTTIDVAPPAAGSANHTVAYWSADNSSHVETAKTANFTIVADATPPSTTSDAKGSYTGPATIRLTATDNGTRGVKATYYRIDGGAATAGTVVSVPQPASGIVSHDVEFWSVDWSNVEEIHHTATFTSGVDSIAPVTTISGTAQWLKFYRVFATLDAVDTGDAGVAASYAILDGTYLFGGPSSGHLYTNSSSVYLNEGVHSFEYWSVDAVGNTEVHKTESFGVDWHGPNVTSNVQSTYTGTATIQLTGSDPHSGLKQISYKIDGGTTQVGTTVVVPPPASGNVYHTVQYTAEDNAGNVTTGSISFRVYAGVTDTTPPSGTMSVNSNAAYATAAAATVNSAMTDSGTGMSQMRIDPGTGVFGSWVTYNASYAITLSGDGTKTVRAEYRDVAGNVAARSDTIVLDTVAPSGTMTIDNDAVSASSTAVSVTSAMSDATSGLYQMRVDPGTGTYGAWGAYSTSQAITLPAGNGLKTVNVQYRDNAGNTVTKTDTITLDVLIVDFTAPITTSDAVGMYSGDATIHLTATDNAGGSGVAHTYYILDGGAQAEGTTIVVTAPPTGSASHTIEFWSVDVAGNPEFPHGSANFTVASLSGAASATYAYTGASQVFTVPSGVSEITVDLFGGQGGDIDWISGGRGGQVHATIPVVAGQVLTVNVGGGVGDAESTGGWPNGGGCGGGHGSAGGGSSTIVSGASILAEAGGGGGADHNDGPGGDGGYDGWLPGGGQPGGWADGTGGGGGWNDGGGDGGTSYIAVGTGILTPGANSGHGQVTVSWVAN